MNNGWNALAIKVILPDIRTVRGSVAIGRRTVVVARAIPATVGCANLQEQLRLFHKVGNSQTALGRIQMDAKAFKQVHFEGIPQNFHGLC